MRTLPDPRWDSRRPVPAVLWGDGTPGVSIPPGPSTTQTHSQQPLRVVVDGMCPSTEWQRTTPASPRVVRRGTARPAEKSFHSASFEAKHRNSTTIRRAGQSRIAFRSVPRDADDCNSTVPSCVFFLPEHTESGFAGHRRRLGKDAVPMLQPQPCHRGRAPSRLAAAVCQSANAGPQHKGEGRAPSRPCPFLTQKWYRPDARCTRAALGAGRPNAGGRNVL